MNMLFEFEKSATGRKCRPPVAVHILRGAIIGIAEHELPALGHLVIIVSPATTSTFFLLITASTGAAC